MPALLMAVAENPVDFEVELFMRPLKPFVGLYQGFSDDVIANIFIKDGVLNFQYFAHGVVYTQFQIPINRVTNRHPIGSLNYNGQKQQANSTESISTIVQLEEASQRKGRSALIQTEKYNAKNLQFRPASRCLRFLAL